MLWFGGLLSAYVECELWDPGSMGLYSNNWNDCFYLMVDFSSGRPTSLSLMRWGKS